MTPPSIADAKELAHRLRSRGVLILAVGDGRLGVSSYGMTRRDCDAMKAINNQIADLIADETIEIPEALRGGR